MQNQRISRASGRPLTCTMCGRRATVLDEEDYCDICRTQEVGFRNGQRAALFGELGTVVERLRGCVTDEQLRHGFELALAAPRRAEEEFDAGGVGSVRRTPMPAQIDAAARELAEMARDPRLQGGQLVLRGEDLSEAQWYPLFDVPADIEDVGPDSARIAVPVPDTDEDATIETCRARLDAAIEGWLRRWGYGA